MAGRVAGKVAFVTGAGRGRGIRVAEGGAGTGLELTVDARGTIR